ncbi:MAG: hypothetical protein KF856_17960 [Cyclobacteriaceae bacterium]|nr:hypothetical protein [Cyclobacteriaceae bacterium]
MYENEGFSLSKRLWYGIKDNPANPIYSVKSQPGMGDDHEMCLDNGRRIRVLNIVDHFNRQCKGISVDLT